MKKIIPIVVLVAIGGVVAYITLLKEESLDKVIISKCKGDRHIDEIELAEIADFMREKDEYTNYSDQDVYDFLNEHKLVASNGVTIAPIISPPEAEVEGINFYIETSGSMKGFLGCPGVFTNVSNQLAVTLEGIYKSINWNPKTIAENITIYDDKSKFSKLLTTGKLQCQGHSPLHKIFKQINDSTGANDINVFITDAILSGTDQEIRQSTNREFNRIQIVGLQDEITKTFWGENIPKDYGVIIYAFCSDFCDAPYYDYKNIEHYENSMNRPFYVFLTGKISLLEEADTELKQKSELFKPIQELRLGFNPKSLKSYNLCNGFNLSKECVVLPDYVKIKDIQDIDGNNPIEFAIALDLSALPKYAKGNEFLNQNLKVDSENKLTNMSVAVFDKEGYLAQISKASHRANMEKKLINWNTTHLIIIHSDGIADYLKMKVELPQIVDDWYVEWTTEDDQNNYNSCNSTFGLSYLVNGIKKGLEDEVEDFIEIEFEIRRK